MRINTKASCFHSPASEAMNEWQLGPSSRDLEAEYQTQHSSLCLVHRLLADRHPGVHTRLSRVDYSLESRLDGQVCHVGIYDKLYSTFVFFSTSISISFSLSVLLCSSQAIDSFIFHLYTLFTHSPGDLVQYNSISLPPNSATTSTILSIFNTVFNYQSTRCNSLTLSSLL